MDEKPFMLVEYGNSFNIDSCLNLPLKFDCSGFIPEVSSNTSKAYFNTCLKIVDFRSN